MRYHSGTAQNGWNVTAMAYKGDWNATDQIPQRAISSGRLGRYDGVDNTDGGNARRYSLSGAWRRSAGGDIRVIRGIMAAAESGKAHEFGKFD